jgi:hypothetical protein
MWLDVVNIACDARYRWKVDRQRRSADGLSAPTVLRPKIPNPALSSALGTSGQVVCTTITSNTSPGSPPAGDAICKSEPLVSALDRRKGALYKVPATGITPSRAPKTVGT